MALSGIQIYKLLPQTNCKDCGFPTCLAFAMKLASKQAEPESCPHLSEEAKSQLLAAARPPVQMVALKSDGFQVQAGAETVMHRHEKRFFNKPGLFLRVYDSAAPDAIKARVAEADAYAVDYVGMALTVDGFAVQADGGDFGAAVAAVRAASKRPLILIGDPEALKAGLTACAEGETPMLGFAAADNWEAMVALAKAHNAALAVRADTLDEMVTLVEKITGAGFENLALAPRQRSIHGMLTANTLIRRLALKQNFRPCGYPILSFPGDAGDPSREVMLAGTAIAKYGGFIVLDHFDGAAWYPLLVMRENLYTDPQKPIQVTPGLYEINNPGPASPVLTTTNFSITYFAVANEVDGSGLPAWLLVNDAEGMSVLTSWAAGKFDAERIAKSVKEFNVAEKLEKKVIVLPGHVAVLSGELEEELPGWEIKVGPREAVDIPAFMKQVLGVTPGR